MATLDLRDRSDDDLDAESLGALVAREPERPLYAHVRAESAASLSLLAKLGFTEVSRETAFDDRLGRDAEVIVLALPPTLE